MSNQWLDESVSDDPRTRSVRVHRDGDDLVMRHRWGSSFAARVLAGFTFLWLIAWTVGCISLLRRAIEHPSLEATLFVVLFLDVWIFVFCYLCGTLFGRTDLRLGSDGLTFTQSVLFFRLTRQVPLAEIKDITQYSKRVEHEEGGWHTERGLMFVTLGKPLRVAQGVSPKEISLLIDFVNRHVQLLIRGTNPGQGLSHTIEGRGNEPFPKGTVIGPPSDSEVEILGDSDNRIILRRHPLNLTELGITTFVNFLWNSLLVIYAYSLVFNFRWWLFLLLIPFEVIGTFMFLKWIAALTSPWRREEWSIGADEITTRSTIFGLSRSRVHDAQSLVSIEVRRVLTAEKLFPLPRLSGKENDRPFAVAFGHRDECDLLVIDDLTEGEALWIERELRVFLKDRRYLTHHT